MKADKQAAYRAGAKRRGIASFGDLESFQMPLREPVDVLVSSHLRFKDSRIFVT
jgi:hypothetical protein